MVDRTAIETHNIEKMGEGLGEQYSALWQEVASIHFHWSEFEELFNKKTRVDLLNQAAPAFFRMVQDQLWEGTLLHIARLTDPPHTGAKERKNLTVQNLSSLIDDPLLKTQVKVLVANAVKAATFSRDWRNRHIAHRDLALALNGAVVPLAEASTKDVNAALKALVAVMNAVDGHYHESETRFDLYRPHNGAVALLYILDDGIKAGEARAKRIENGDFSEADFRAREL